MAALPAQPANGLQTKKPWRSPVCPSFSLPLTTGILFPALRFLPVSRGDQMTLAMTSDDGIQIGLSPWTVANSRQPGPRSATSLDLRRNIVRYLAVVAGGFPRFSRSRGPFVDARGPFLGFLRVSHSPNRSPTNNSPERGGPTRPGGMRFSRVRYDDRPITHVAAVTTSRLFCRARPDWPALQAARHAQAHQDGQVHGPRTRSPRQAGSGCRRCAPALNARPRRETLPTPYE